ncbi:MAG: CBS domain-containing protein [Planctomycetota bacterium]
MKSKQLQKYMVPLSDYATVNENATLYEAVIELEKVRQDFGPGKHPHRAVLVKDGEDKIVGKLSLWDVIKALEPRYREITDFKHSMRFGFSTQFVHAMVQNYGLWQKPIEDICRKAAGTRVKDVMYTPAEGEYVKEDATFDEAVHMLVIGHHQSLLVTDKKGEHVIGVLRLVDVFNEISDLIKANKP